MYITKKILILTIILSIVVSIIFSQVKAIETEEEEVYTSVLSNNGKEKEDVGNLTYAAGVTNEMCESSYWSNKAKNAEKILMTKKEIEKLNQDIINRSGTNVIDITQTQETKTATERTNRLASAEIPTRDLYINGNIINNDEYFTKLKQAISDTGYKGDEAVQYYAVAVKRAELKDWPTNDIIGYKATDPDDEIESSILNVNEPFVINGKCEVDGETFYWGHTNICPGWINAKSLAICEDKQEWLDAWNVDIESKDFLVVTQDKITLEPSITVPETSEVQLMIGTKLKLVPTEQIPTNIGERGPWNNYVVYLPTRDENGKYARQYALISQHYSVSIGYLDMTQKNILDVAFSCLGNRYGWGGMLGAMDCTLYTRCIYECFGLELPRNTTWQQITPGKIIDVSTMNDEEKEKYIESLPAGSLLYFSGHAMVYVGSENNTNYAISATGSLSDSVGEVNVRSMYSVIINPLTTRRANKRTWLNNISAVLVMNPLEAEEIDDNNDEENTGKENNNQEKNETENDTQEQAMNSNSTNPTLPFDSTIQNDDSNIEKATNPNIGKILRIDNDDISKSPKTGDEITMHVLVLIISIQGMIIAYLGTGPKFKKS